MSKKRVSEEPAEEMQEETEMEWSKKRVIIGFIVSVIAIGGMYFVGSSFISNHKPTVLGIQAENSSSVSPAIKPPTQKDMEKIISQAQEELKQITPQNVLSSQAAITKLISDLQKLQNGKESPKDAFCKMVCK